MWSARRRSERPDLTLRRIGASLEALETRALLSAQSDFHFYQPTDRPVIALPHNATEPTTFHPQSAGARQLSFLDNDGKILTGVDRQGDEWTITVHGPGAAIVSDISPNDGMLDDELNTIQLIGTSLQDTYVTGQVIASDRLQTNSEVTFNHLIATGGVHSIILEGFTLTQEQNAPTAINNATEPAIFLPGGVQILQFHDIDANFDLAGGTAPVDIVIGQPNNPLPVQPVIRLDSIFNTVFNSTLTVNPPTAQVDPTVNILVNGQLHGIDFISSTAVPVPAAVQFAFPVVGTTGRTAIRALGVGNLTVPGSAHNLTVSRQAIPFRDGLSGVDHIGSATFGGNADAVGLDVAGPIGKLEFLHGLGNPTGTSVAATSFGTPTYGFGYPAYGFYGGLVTANQIGKLEVASANTVLQTANNPNFVMLRRQGLTFWYPRPGNALTHSAIVSSGSIGQTTVVGNLQTSEIKSGFHYPSFVAGLEPTRAPSAIGPMRHPGDLVDSVISATVRPFQHIYNIPGVIYGPGRLTGQQQGTLLQTGGVTSLDNLGAGNFARKRSPGLPPPGPLNRFNSVLFNT